MHCRNWGSETLAKHAKIISVPPTPCDHRHVLRHIMPRFEWRGTSKCSANYGCLRTERDSLLRRHLVPGPQPPSGVAWDVGFSLLRKLIPPRRVYPLNDDEVIRRTPQHKRRLCRDALAENADPSSGPIPTAISAFIKFEKEVDIGGTKAPRMIQHRGPRYCYGSSAYFRRIEDIVFHEDATDGKMHFAKGWTPTMTASKLHEAWGPGKIALLFDHSKFDSLNLVVIRSREHEFYREFFPGSKVFPALLKAQMKNKCRTKSGISYRVNGTIMSGEYNTSLAGCVNNASAILYVLRHVIDIHGVQSVDFMVNGDDSVVIIERKHMHLVDVGDFRILGFDTKVEYAESFNEIDFCQCKPVYTSYGYTMVRNPERLFSRIPYSTSAMATPKSVKHLVASIGLCELWMNAGVPVLQSFASLVRRSGSSPKPRLINEYLEVKKVTQRSETPVIDEARLDFWVAFGVSPDEQIALERYFDSMAALPVFAL